MREENEVYVARTFPKDTIGHGMSVIFEKDLYRHLQFKEPASGIYGYHLQTAPGTLTITGDMGTYVFSRLRDMFDFFTGNVNVGYWGEKCIASSSPIREFSEDKFVREVLDDVEHYIEDTIDEWIEENQDDDDFDPNAYERDILEALEEHVFGPFADFPSPDEAYRLLEYFVPVHGLEFVDVGEYDFREYTIQFLWCLHAIKQGIEKYNLLQGAK